MLRVAAAKKINGGGASGSTSSSVVPSAKKSKLFRASTPSNMEADEIGDTVSREVEHWEKLGTEVTARFELENGSLNEFAMMWELRKSFPLHYIVFKQCAAHLPHEGNSEQTFSRAGQLSDPNINPIYLARLTKIGINKKVYEPPFKDIKNGYYKKFSKNGQLAEEKDANLGFAIEPKA